MTDSKILTKNIIVTRKSEQLLTFHYKSGDEDLNKEKFSKLLQDLGEIYDNFFN